MDYESQTLEYKRELGSDICKEVIAFANAQGGRLCIGVEDDGSVVGVDAVDDCQVRFSQMIESNITPDIRPFVSWVPRNYTDKTVIEVTIEEGDQKPYCLARKGFIPAGVYVRRGAGCQQASHDMIRRMMQDTYEDAFECRRSPVQNLTFRYASEYFDEEGVAFNRESLVTLGIARQHEESKVLLFSNLGHLLSDQCAHSIKCAVFQDNAGTEFQAREEFGGSVFRQLDEAFRYIELNNRTLSTVDGIKRIDHRDYPSKAIREALLNAIVHRDYAYRDSTLVNIYPDRCEFITLGGLVGGLGVEDIRNGVSALRNRGLAHIFYRLNLVESYGTGIRTIFNLYEGVGHRPEIKATAHSFSLMLPNANETPPSISYAYMSFQSDEQKIIDYLEQNAVASRVSIEVGTGLTRNVAIAALKELRNNNFVRQVGAGPKTQYALAPFETWEKNDEN